jgi:hypothetical protein
MTSAHGSGSRVSLRKSNKVAGNNIDSSFRNGHLTPLNDSHLQEERRPSDLMADVELSTERQRIANLIASVPDAKLRAIEAAVRVALSRDDAAATRRVHTEGAPSAHSANEAFLNSARDQLGGMKRASDQRRHQNGKPKLPKLPPGLKWPTKKYFVENRKNGVNIQQFLEAHWLPLIRAGFGERRWLRLVDSSAARGIENFERVDLQTGIRRRLPDHLHFLTEREVTDRRLPPGLSAVIEAQPRLVEAFVHRARRNHKEPIL